MKAFNGKKETKENKENTSQNEGDMRKNADRVIEIY